MKKAILAIMVLGLCFGLANAAMAVNTDSTTVTVEVEDVEDLVAPTDVTILMSYTVGQHKYTVRIIPDKTSRITYVNNSGTAQTKKISASAVAGGANADNDIDITVKVAGGEANPTPIVVDGVGVSTAEAVVLWTGIEPGDYTKDVTWEASATYAGTPAGTYKFDVTFTAADE